jgi:hypothetical protein
LVIGVWSPPPLLPSLLLLGLLLLLLLLLVLLALVLVLALVPASALVLGCRHPHIGHLLCK